MTNTAWRYHAFRPRTDDPAQRPNLTLVRQERLFSAVDDIDDDIANFELDWLARGYSVQSA